MEVGWDPVLVTLRFWINAGRLGPVLVTLRFWINGGRFALRVGDVTFLDPI